MRRISRRRWKISSRQDNIVIILNGIANNPTGNCLSDEEWQAAIDVLKEAVKDETKKAILIPDVAYLDYSGEKEECRKFFRLFGGLPKNIPTVCAYTLSKGFTMYGQRMGAMIGISSDKDVIKEFVDINQYASRATWSNCNSAAQNAMIRICRDDEKIKALDAERAKYFRLIQDRAAIFMKEARRGRREIRPLHLRLLHHHPGYQVPGGLRLSGKGACLHGTAEERHPPRRLLRLQT